MIYGAIQAPHTLPSYVPIGWLFKRGIKQLCMDSIPSLSNTKQLCPTYPLYMGMYGIIGFTWEKMEGENIKENHFNLERAQMHDLLYIAAKHRS